jgi:hypothetical protein
MKADEDKPIVEFESWNQFAEFSQFVKRKARHILDERNKCFLQAVLNTSTTRKMVIEKGVTLWRAQRDNSSRRIGARWCLAPTRGPGNHAEFARIFAENPTDCTTSCVFGRTSCAIKNSKRDGLASLLLKPGSIPHRNANGRRDSHSAGPRRPTSANREPLANAEVSLHKAGIYSNR